MAVLVLTERLAQFCLNRENCWYRPKLWVQLKTGSGSALNSGLAGWGCNSVASLGPRHRGLDGTLRTPGWTLAKSIDSL